MRLQKSYFKSSLFRQKCENPTSTFLHHNIFSYLAYKINFCLFGPNISFHWTPAGVMNVDVKFTQHVVRQTSLKQFRFCLSLSFRTINFVCQTTKVTTWKSPLRPRPQLRPLRGPRQNFAQHQTTTLTTPCQNCDGLQSSLTTRWRVRNSAACYSTDQFFQSRLNWRLSPSTTFAASPTPS